MQLTLQRVHALSLGQSECSSRQSPGEVSLSDFTCCSSSCPLNPSHHHQCELDSKVTSKSDPSQDPASLTFDSAPFPLPRNRNSLLCPVNLCLGRGWFLPQHSTYWSGQRPGSTFLITLVTAQGSLPPGHGYMVMGCSTVFSAMFLSLTLHLAYTSPATQALEELPLLWELSQTCYHRKEKAHTHSEQRDTLRLQSWGTQDSSLRS